MIIELILITILVVYIVDLSGVIDSIKYGLWRWLRGNEPYRDYRLKPFDCSLCMTFWIGLIWLILSHSVTLNYLVVVCILSYLSDVIGHILGLIKDLIITLINRLN